MITTSWKEICTYTLPVWFALGVLAAPSKADFQDPLILESELRKNLFNQPLIGSAHADGASVLVGPVGLIMISTDAGRTWEQGQVPVQSDLVAVDMVSASRGWAVGHDGVILSTTNGGRTWIKQFDGLMAAEQFVRYYQGIVEKGDIEAAAALELTELNYRDGPGLPYLDVWFRDEAVGYVVGAFGNIARTDDGGETWIPLTHQIDNEAGLHLNSVTGVGDDIYIGSERGTLFKLNKENNRFEIIETGYSGSFTGVLGNAHYIVAYGIQGAVYQSADAGITWEAVNQIPESTINGAYLRRAEGGFVFANQAGQLILTDPYIKNIDVLSFDGSAGYTSVIGVGDSAFLTTTLEGMKLISISDRKSTKIGNQE